MDTYGRNGHPSLVSLRGDASSRWQSFSNRRRLQCRNTELERRTKPIERNEGGVLHPPLYLMPQHIGARPAISNYEISLQQGEIPQPNSDSWTWWCGRRYKISLDNASNISKVALVRVASVTHGFDQNQRYVPLSIAEVNENQNYIIVNAPPNRYYAPPGLYMLFVMRMNNAGNDDIQLVPSMAKYVKLTDMNVVDPNPPPE